MITPLPQPPNTGNPATFDTLADAFIDALPTMVEEINIVATDIDTKHNYISSATPIVETNASICLASANYKGLWSSLTGALNKPASVSHNNKFWLLNTNLANVTLAQPGISASWKLIDFSITVVPYDNRVILRSLSPSIGDKIIVEDLGLFTYTTSNAVDDGESAFRTASGVWVLVAGAPEYIYSAIYNDVLGIQNRASSLESKHLFGSFSMTLTSLATITSSDFTCIVTGAAIGDNVVVTPGNLFGTSAADRGKLSYSAYVSAANTVTISIRNASASTASMTASTWQVMVIKS